MNPANGFGASRTGKPAGWPTFRAFWDDATYHVWFPASESVVRATAERLKPLDASETGHAARIRYVLYAARIANLLSEDVLLAPASASVIPCRTN